MIDILYPKQKGWVPIDSKGAKIPERPLDLASHIEEQSPLINLGSAMAIASSLSDSFDGFFSPRAHLLLIIPDGITK